MSHLEAITIHAERPGELARFWSALLDLPIDPADAVALEEGTLGDSEAVLLGRRDGLHVWLSPAEELPLPGARVHLDIGLDGPGDLDRLADLGAVPRWDDPAGRWRVFADPEGNLFCAVVPRESSTGPAEPLPDSPVAAPAPGEKDGLVFVLLLTYVAKLDEIDAATPAHRRFLDDHFEAGDFLASGPQDPRTGGVILARARNRAAIERIIAEDPFARDGLATYDVHAFHPTHGPFAAPLLHGRAPAST
ncbi:MAG: VOC family protein [Marmoricola sp.]